MPAPDGVVEILRALPSLARVPVDGRRAGGGVQMMSDTILDFDDDQFAYRWGNLTDAQRSTIGEAGFERYRRLMGEIRPPAPQPQAMPPEQPKRARITNGAELMAREFAPIVEIVPGLLPEGLMLLAARPKVGKSWLALQLGLAVATDGEFLGRRVVGGSVLYLALEDSDRRMRARLEKLGAAGLDLTRFHYATAWDRGLDGAAEIAQWVRATPDARLVVVDVLAKLREARSGRDSGYAQDYDDIAILKPAAGRGVAVLLVHHTRKATADDPLDEVSGTLGVAGAADGAWVLKRGRGSDDGELHLIGRDVEAEGAFAVRFNRETCRWEWQGEAWRARLSAERREVLEALAVAPMGPADLAKALGKRGDAVRYLLSVMARDGQVDKGIDGRYRPIEPQ
jgi:hypothetical protein